MSDPYLHQYQLKQSPPADPQLSNSYPPPNIYYASESSNPYPANDRHRPNLTLPASTFTPDYNLAFTYPDQPLGQSPYHTPLQMNPNSGGSASSSTVMSEYFPPYPPPIQTQPYPLLSPVYQTPKNKVGGKTGRQQFSACGACRHRRVKCDLKEKQERESKSICSNCQERGIACIDEYAPIKAAKQLRRGKRISEIEVLYGNRPAPPKPVLPELTQAFFDSPFFRRFQVQRPVLDRDFSQRYLAVHPPSAAALGTEGAILCHVLYAWALSYGVDENGQLDVPEGGGEPLGPLPLGSPSENELRREADRQRRFQRMRGAVEVALKEIDEHGVMRKPTWDGVRSLLLILPLTEGISTSVERLSMYEAALNQVYTLCSFAGLGYDGQPSGVSGVNGGTDSNGIQDIQLIRVRIYWYAFVHEGITTGLKGGRLLLDDEDLDTIQDSIHHRAIVSSSFSTTLKFATAPINLALACRLINRALTGPSARRSKTVNAVWVKEAWEALEKSWEEFEALKYTPDAHSLYSSMDEVIRFADGWKIFLFEAQNVIRKILDERISGASIISSAELSTLHRLLDISKSKCEVKSRQILDMVRRHVGSRFFEWDASLVRDGTFYAAKLLPRLGGCEDDISVCLQALNELRWAHAKAFDRSAELRQEWAESRADLIYHPELLPLSGSGSPHDLSMNTGYEPLQPAYPSLQPVYDPSAIPRVGSGIWSAEQPGFVYGHMPGPPPLTIPTGYNAVPPLSAAYDGGEYQQMYHLGQ